MRRTKVVEAIRPLWRKIQSLTPDIVNDDYATFRIKNLLNDPDIISTQDRVLFILYSEVGSLQNLANLLSSEFRISKSTLRNEIARIKRIIRENL